ncbi:MAG TPA: hypothetical protein VF057_09160 [Thermoanaerobaculia bacterium]
MPSAFGETSFARAVIEVATEEWSFHHRPEGDLVGRHIIRFDDMGWPAEEWDHAGSPLQAVSHHVYRRDRGRLVLHECAGRGSRTTTRYSYDANGRRSEETSTIDDRGRVLGRRLLREDSDGIHEFEEFTEAVDMLDVHEGLLVAVPGARHVRSHHGGDRITREIFGTDDQRISAITIEFVQDRATRVTERRATSSPSTLAEYDYDEKGRLAAVAISVAGLSAYRQIYSYDDRNLPRETVTFGPDDSIVQRVSIEYEFNAEGDWWRRSHIDALSADRRPMSMTVRGIVYR